MSRSEPNYYRGAWFKYFYINDKLFRTLEYSTKRNRLLAYDYADKKKRMFVYSDVRKKMQRVYNVPQVADMLNRHPQSVRNYIYDGYVDPPQTHNIETGGAGIYLFPEDMVLELYKHMANTHRGRPRKDGWIVPDKTLPERAELLSKLRPDDVLYKKQGDEFVAVWREETW